jgi:hypothetical protein
MLTHKQLPNEFEWQIDFGGRFAHPRTLPFVGRSGLTAPRRCVTFQRDSRIEVQQHFWRPARQCRYASIWIFPVAGRSDTALPAIRRSAVPSRPLLRSTADNLLALHEGRCVQHEEQRHEECRD